MKLTGLNMQWPWSRLVLSGEKTVETRGYPLPRKYIGIPLAIIETPGPRGKKEAGISNAKVIGIVVFSESFKYLNMEHWLDDFKRHKVPIDDKAFAFNPKKPKWGWVVKSVQKVREPTTPPKPRGIVFASDVNVRN